MAVIVGGVIEKDGKFLLVQETKEKCYGKWNIPAGHLDDGETIIEGAKREILEETGFNVELNGLLSITTRKDLFLGIVFKATIISGDIKYNKEEILDAKWFTYEEIISMKESLRSKVFVMSAIEAFISEKVVSLDIINVIN